jgi:tetratricopeptide (TPR) repeat protein
VTRSDTSLFSLRGIQEMLGISRGVITRLINAGFVSPQRGSRNEYLFTFRDVVLLRTAHGLMTARIAPRRILRSLERLKQSLPDDMPLTGLRITAVGGEVAVREVHGQRSAETGQYLIDFELAQTPSAVAQLPGAESPSPEESVSAQQWLEAAAAVEADDPDEAEAAYLEAIALSPDFPDAHLNLSALLCERERFDEALKVCDEALARWPDNAELHFNRALALEELQRFRLALRDYERCIELSPDFAQAHFNLAALFERTGEVQKALRHFNAYRRLSR